MSCIFLFPVCKAADTLFYDPGTDWNNGTVLFGNRNKHRWTDHLSIRVLPADQRFHSTQLSVLNMILRLEIQRKVLVKYSILQLIFNSNILKEIIQDQGIKILNRRFSWFFGLKHDDLCTVDQFKGRFGRFRILCYTNGYTDADLLSSTEDPRWFYTFSDCPVNIINTAVSIWIVNSNTIDICIKVGYNYILTVKFWQILSKLLYYFIANYNAKTVIDLSEIINIYKHDSNNVLFVFCFSYKIGKKTYKIVSVVQSCQNIVICHIGQFIVLILYLGNIFKTDDLIHRYIHLIIDHGNLTLNPGFSVLQSYDRTVRLYSRFFEEEKLLKRKNIFFFYFPVNLADILDFPDLHTFKKIVPVGYCLHIMIFKIDIYKSTGRCLTDQFQHFFFFFKLLIQGVQ